jgi:hypothetical protein
MAALIFLLMLSIIGALVQSATLQYQKSEDRVRTRMALESTFAEYHLELLEKYEIFSRHGSEEVLQNRLAYYGADGIAHSVIHAEYLTDNQGMPFYRQAVRYMKDLQGVSNTNWDRGITFAQEDVSEEEQKVLESLGELLEQTTEDNPVRYVQTLKKSNLLQLLISDSNQISNRTISLEDTPSHRELQKGTITTSERETAADRMLFQGYLMEYFHSYRTEESTRTLFYELEYLLGGSESDIENLEAVCKRILTIRMVANYVYLLGSSTRTAEAETTASTICTLLGMPQMTEVMKQGILFAWSYGESIVDVRALLKGKKVPAVKTDDSWQLQLENLTKLGSDQEEVQEKESENGLSYEAYVQGLLLLEEKETICMRCLDLIEKNVNIKMDACYTAVEIQSVSKETFTTVFGYQ